MINTNYSNILYVNNISNTIIDMKGFTFLELIFFIKKDIYILNIIEYIYQILHPAINLYVASLLLIINQKLTALLKLVEEYSTNIPIYLLTMLL